MRFVVLAISLTWFGCQADRTHESITIFAAASLTDVMEAFADTFETTSRYQIALNVAGSSMLARQISMGADADLFVSAHPTWTDFLRDRGRLTTVDTLPITNTLVLVSRADADIFSAEQIAVADPEHVPAGMYAKEALQCEGWWAELEDDIVPTLDVRAALEAVSGGAAVAGIVYASDAMLTPELITRNIFSQECLPEVTYTVGITHTSRAEAVRFAAFLQDSSMISMWNQLGFSFRSSEDGRTQSLKPTE